MYLAESQSQYNECYGEASEQSALLELQRDAISELRKRISHLECDEFVQAFILHFIYYVILFKYQEELNFKNEKYSALMCKIQDLECAKTNAEKQRDNYQCKFQEASKEIEKLWCRFEESRQKMCARKQSEIDALLSENDDLRQQLETYKIDFNIIEEEMKKMGMVDNSVESFKIEIDTLRSENEQSKCTVENYRKTIVELKTNNEYLAKTLQEYQTCADNDIQKYKEQIMKFQCEFRWQNEEIKQLKIELLKNEEMINKLIHRIDDLKAELRETERRLLSCQSDLESSKQTNCALKNHIDTLKMFQDKFDLIEKLEKDNYDLKNEHCIMKSNMALYDEKTKNEMSLLKFRLKQTQCELLDVQKNHNKALQDLSKNRSYLNKLMTERRAIDTCSHPNSACQAGSSRDQSSASRPCEAEELRRLTKQLEECHKTIQSKSSAYSELQTKYNAMSNKCDSFERSVSIRGNKLRKKYLANNEVNSYTFA